MPGQQVGVYPGQQVAGTEVSSTYEGRHVTVLESELIHPFRASTFVNKGDPVLLCRTAVPATYGIAVGVAFNTAIAATDLIAVDTEGIWNLTVYAEDDNGNAAIEIGDPIYIHDGSTGAATLNGLGDAELSKITNPATQRFFGMAYGRMVAGGSGVIAVKVHFDQLNNWCLEDAPMYWGDDREISAIYTGEEICYTDERTIDDSDGYWRTIHVAGDITFTDADVTRYASVSCYTEVNAETLGGGAGVEAFGGKFSLKQGPNRAITGYFGAVMAEVKNEADNPSTACALFLRWDNDAAVGFGGVMHSFIRLDDNSSAQHCTNLLEMYLMDATAAADPNVIVCQCGAANTPSHVIKITANGIPYWILMDSTPPA